MSASGLAHAHQAPPTPAVRPARLRVLPVPVAEPQPLSRDVPGRQAPPVAQGTLALSFAVERRPDPDDDRLFGPQPTSSRHLPDAHAAAAAIVQAVLEVLAGTRPPAQLVRWLSSDVYAAISRRAALAARMRAQSPTAVRAAVVRRVRLCEPADGVVEASAVVVVHERVRAVAVRLEGLDGRWRVTALEVG